MYRYIWKRLLTVLPVMFGITLLTFSLTFFTPGDPAEILLEQAGGSLGSAEDVAALREQLGLNNPWFVQYGQWVSRVIQGDAGVSYRTGNTVFSEILLRLPVTVTLASLALLWASCGGIIMGVMMVVLKGKCLGNFLRGINQMILAMPSFLLALLSILLMGEMLHLLPTSGIDSPLGYLLPSLALSLITMATVAQLLDSRLREELGALYCNVARTRGMKEGRVLLLYALPNALLPVIAMLGNFCGSLLGGAVIIETIFAIPGIGSLAMEAIRFRDYPLLQGYVLFTGAVFVLVSLAVDLLLHYVDSRVRLEENS